MPTSTVQAVELIIGCLTRIPQIDESTTKRLYTRYAADPETAKAPADFKPGRADTWQDIIFREKNWKTIKKNGEVSPKYVSRIENILRVDLKLVATKAVVQDRSLLARLCDLLENLQRSVPGKVSVGIEQSPRDLRAALETLLGMKANEHYDLNKTIVGEYFGYRRSSNRGRIVRFYIKIEEAGDAGLLSFKNEYYQEPDHWMVKGCGFDRDGLTNLIGHACEADDEDVGLGIRFFVLNKFRRLGWFVGLLNSLDRNQQPIASRIVLIPVEQHKLARVSDPLTSKQILTNISSKSLSAQILDRQIKVENVASLRGNSVSTVVQALIWNGTLRTLHAPNTYIPGKREGAAYRRVFDFQRKALTPPPKTTNDIEVFARLLDSSDFREAVLPAPPPKSKGR